MAVNGSPALVFASGNDSGDYTMATAMIMRKRTNSSSEDMERRIATSRFRHFGRGRGRSARGRRRSQTAPARPRPPQRRDRRPARISIGGARPDPLPCLGHDESHPSPFVARGGGARPPGRRAGRDPRAALEAPARRPQAGIWCKKCPGSRVADAETGRRSAERGQNPRSHGAAPPGRRPRAGIRDSGTSQIAGCGRHPGLPGGAELGWLRIWQALRGVAPPLEAHARAASAHLRRRLRARFGMRACAHPFAARRRSRRCEGGARAHSCERGDGPPEQLRICAKSRGGGALG